MQGFQASSVVDEPADLRRKTEVDVQALRLAVDLLKAKQAGEAQTRTRWQDRLNRAEDSAAADSLVECTVELSRSSVKLSAFTNALQRCEALLSTAQQRLQTLVAAAPAQAGGPAATASPPSAALAAAAPPPAGGPFASASPPAGALAAVPPPQAGGPVATASPPAGALAAASPPQAGGGAVASSSPAAALAASALPQAAGPAAVAPAPVAAHAAPFSSGRELGAILRDLQKVKMASPTSREETILRYPLAAMSMEAPLTVPSRLPAEWYADKTNGGLTDKKSFGEEAAYYTKATAFLPSWVQLVKGGSRTARQLYGSSDSKFYDCHFVAMPWRCEPELLTRSTRGCPGFNGELKSLPEVAWDEVVTYVCCSMVHSMFPPSPNRLRFHFDPPYGYGLMGVTDSCFMVAVEWVGRLFVTPISEHFLLGGPEHKQVVGWLKGDPVQQCVEVSISQPGVLWDEFPASKTFTDVIWTRSPAELRIVSMADERAEPTIVRDQFIKVVTCSAFPCNDESVSNRRWRELHRVYKQYATVCAAAPETGPGCLPRALSRARLLYGYFSVMVHMPFQRGRHAVVEELCSGPVLQQLAEAIAWLAWRGLLYYDVRTPNIIVRSDGASATAALVDYDDMVIVEPHTIKTFDDYIAALARVMKDRGEQDVTECLLTWEALCDLINVELANLQ